MACHVYTISKNTLVLLPNSSRTLNPNLSPFPTSSFRFFPLHAVHLTPSAKLSIPIKKKETD